MITGRQIKVIEKILRSPAEEGRREIARLGITGGHAVFTDGHFGAVIELPDLDRKIEGSIPYSTLCDLAKVAKARDEIAITSEGAVLPPIPPLPLDELSKPLQRLHAGEVVRWSLCAEEPQLPGGVIGISSKVLGRVLSVWAAFADTEAMRWTFTGKLDAASLTAQGIKICLMPMRIE